MAACSLILGLLAQGRLREFEQPLRSGGDRDTGETRRQEEQDRSSEDRSPYLQEPERTSRNDRDFLDGLFYPCLDHGLRFDDFPYAREKRRFFFLSDDSSSREWSLDLQPYALRLEHDVLAFGLTGKARYSSGGDFRFDLVQFQERVGGGTDRLTLQTYEVNYGPGPGRRDHQWTLGWGVAVLEGQETHAGVSLQGAIDWFPLPPLSLRVHAAALVFSGSTILDVQAEVGFHWNRFALGLGFRTLVNSQGDDLTGPMASLTVWF